MACYHRFITRITGFFIILSLSLSVGARVRVRVCGAGFPPAAGFGWFSIDLLRGQGGEGGESEGGGEVRGWGERESVREMRLCVFVTGAHGAQKSDRGKSVRRITCFAELYVGKVEVSSDWLVLSFPPVFGFPLPPPSIPRSSCVLMPLRTRGGEEGEKSEAEEAEGEVRRPGHFSSSPFGGLSSLPSWTCMDGHGESWMLLPRGWAPRLPVSGASLPATTAADHRSLLRCSHR